MKILVFLLLFVPALATAETLTRDGVSLTAPQETQAEAIGNQLRCLVCQNESVEDSSASLAKQLRVIIRQQVIAGRTAAEIKAYMVQRYGIFVLLKPPLSPLTALLYASPFVALAAAALLGRAVMRTRTAPVPELSEAERARLHRLLG